MSTSSPAAEQPGADAPLLVFNSYSRKDQKWLELLQAHLAPLEREGTIRLWVDKGKIEYGDRYNDEIATAIDTCGAAILLISPHFQNSSFIQEKELPRLLRRADAKEIKLYWLQVSDCHLAKKLAKTYHSTNDSQQPLDGMSETQVNKVLSNLAQDLENHAIQVKATRHATARAEEARRAREAAEEKQRAAREEAAREAAEREAARAEKARLVQEAAAEKQRAKRAAAPAASASQTQRSGGFQLPSTKLPADGKKSSRKGFTFLWSLGALLALGFVVTQAKKWMAPQQPAQLTVTDEQLGEAARELAAKEAAVKEVEILAAKERVAAKATVPPPLVSPPARTPVPPPIIAKGADKAFTNSLGMTFLPVPGTDVLFSVYETRVQDYAAYAAANPGVDMEWKDVERSGNKQPADHPVVNVSWEDAKAFCEWLSQKEGKIYRLPTDHEWSVAVGIGDREDPKQSPEDKNMKLSDVYPWGSTWPPPKDTGNFSGTESASSYKLDDYTDSFPFTAPVGSFKLEHNGIKDLSGNVYEWCQDKYSPSSSAFVLRGGSWLSINRDYLLSSYRSDIDSALRYINRGFRCVLVGAAAGGEAR